MDRKKKKHSMKTRKQSEIPKFKRWDNDTFKSWVFQFQVNDGVAWSDNPTLQTIIKSENNVLWQFEHRNLRTTYSCKIDCSKERFVNLQHFAWEHSKSTGTSSCIKLLPKRLEYQKAELEADRKARKLGLKSLMQVATYWRDWSQNMKIKIHLNPWLTITLYMERRKDISRSLEHKAEGERWNNQGEFQKTEFGSLILEK